MDERICGLGPNCSMKSRLSANLRVPRQVTATATVVQEEAGLGENPVLYLAGSMTLYATPKFSKPHDIISKMRNLIP